VSEGAKGEEVRGAAPIEGVGEGGQKGQKGLKGQKGQKGQKGFDQQWREESLKNVLSQGEGSATELRTELG